MQEAKGLSFKAGQTNRPPLKILLQLCQELGAGGPGKDRAVIPIRQLCGVVLESSKAFVEQSPPARDSGLGERIKQGLQMPTRCKVHSWLQGVW